MTGSIQVGSGSIYPTWLTCWTCVMLGSENYITGISRAWSPSVNHYAWSGFLHQSGKLIEVLWVRLRILPHCFKLGILSLWLARMFFPFGVMSTTLALASLTLEAPSTKSFQVDYGDDSMVVIWFKGSSENSVKRSTKTYAFLAV